MLYFRGQSVGFSVDVFVAGLTRAYHSLAPSHRFHHASTKEIQPLFWLLLTTIWHLDEGVELLSRSASCLRLHYLVALQPRRHQRQLFQRREYRLVQAPSRIKMTMPVALSARADTGIFEMLHVFLRFL